MAVSAGVECDGGERRARLANSLKIGAVNKETNALRVEALPQ